MKLGTAIRDLKRGMTYYPELARVIGGVCPAVLFCSLNWQDKYLVWESDDGMDRKVRKSLKEIMQDTGLTERELRGAREELEEVGAAKSNYLRLEHELEFEVSLRRVDELCRAYEINSNEALVKTSDGGGASDETSNRELTKRQIDHCLETKIETIDDRSPESSIDTTQDILPWMQRRWEEHQATQPRAMRKKFNPGPHADQYERQEEAVGREAYRREFLEYLTGTDNRGVVSFAKTMAPMSNGRRAPGGNRSSPPGISSGISDRERVRALVKNL